jgi:O-antigen ligase
MRAVSISSLRGYSLDQWAFGSLLATVFSITFSIALGQVFAGVAFLLFVIGLCKGRLTFRLPAIVWFAAAFAVVAVVTSWRGGGASGLWGRTGKLLWFMLIPVTASLACRSDRVEKMIGAFLWGSVVLALKDLVKNPLRAWRNPSPDFLTSLIDKGSMTDGQMLMLGLVAGVVMAMATLKAGRRLPGRVWGMLAVQGAGLLIGFKRGSWFCAMLLAGLVLLTNFRWRAWLLLVLVTAAFFSLPPVQTRMGQLKREFNKDGGGRLTMWCRVAPFLIHERPDGVGYGCLTNRMMRYAYRKVEANRNHLHANWAQVLVETGWLGLAVYLLWMGRALMDGVNWVRLTRAGPPGEFTTALAVLMMLAGLLLNGLVEYNFGDTELMFIYAITMGLASAGLSRLRGEAPLFVSRPRVS